MNTNVTITSKGQMTVPKALRDQLDMKPGDKCYAWVRDGELIIVPRNKPLAGLLGMLGRPPASVASQGDDIRDIVSDAAVDRYLRAHVAVEDP
ncbi:looped-hinge helix DNA binding domain-containing protein, AbrB family [Rhizobium sp. RU35A]|uniref:AbrB/MazE/SpoVT family DNA-binding domain-containing protein n=1 Tax=Rhizobium sp. RU35A TaxID=1907414 RepID=UPI000955D22C|nr:AbrB/MazE/SpoVT family DNA-binding domain-containing protein [Rhizobium sp. RU35A]SIQ16704.1 looped-hinge helix DNA binding domain-containing protein, AbrB family [Rhizobium sp. RU35A]